MRLVPVAADSMLQSTVPEGRAAGVFMHISSLPGPGGIGDIGLAARRFVDCLSAMQIGVWQFLPAGPTTSGNSPYLPLSTFAGNEMLIDTAALQRAGLLRRAEIDALHSLPRDRVDYERLQTIKPGLLALAAARFEQRASSRQRALRAAWIERHGAAWLHDYALFRVLKARFGYQPWTDWPPELAQRDRRALRRIEAENAQELIAIKTLQWIFHEQWCALRRHSADAGVRLFGDLPIYVALDSAEAWSRRELFSIDGAGTPQHVAGVPPDYFSDDGQLWGNPLYDWPRHRDDGYAWWIARLRHALTQADLVRIDHFRGFEAYWSVPADAETARAGRWETGPGCGLFDALGDALGPLPVVAENLGEITPQVEALRLRYGIPGMRVLQFEIAAEHFELRSIDENSVCYTGTHDNDTARGWFLGSNAVGNNRNVTQLRQRILERTGGTPESVHTDLVRLAFASPARLSVAPLQDFLGLGSEARMNTPGTTIGNWEWRLQAALTNDQQRRIRLLAQESGRC